MADEQRDSTSSTPMEVGLIEPSVRLSDSLIWQVQTSYYTNAGIDAWASGDVPHLLTSGPLIARSYRRLIEACVEDLCAGRLGEHDPNEPLYVLELGSGTGRLGFCLQRLFEEASRDLPLQVVYVMSDRVRANVEFWKGHERLAPYFSNGTLDAACFDPTSESTLRLEYAKTELGPGSLRNPLVVVANYFFDVIPQDLFLWEDGTLYEELVALGADAPELNGDSDDFYRHIVLSLERQPARDAVYGDQRDEVLFSSGPSLFPNGGRMLFPATALQAIEHVTALSSGRALVLVSERPGAVPQPEADRPPEPLTTAGEVVWKRPGELLAMGVHGGSMSLPVDLNLLTCSSTSLAMRPQVVPTGLEVAALLYTDGACEPVSLTKCYQSNVNEQGPEDVYLVCKAAAENDGGEMGVAVLLAILRLGNFDPYLFQHLYASLQRQLPELPDHLVEELERVLEKVESFDYPIDEITDIDTGIAALLGPIGRYESARSYFARSCDRRGPQAQTMFNLALCDLHLERSERALEALRSAIELDESYEPAKALYAQVFEERERRSLADSQ